MSRHREHPVDPLDEEIRRALAGLPRHEAPEGFTGAVLQRLDEPRSRHAGPGFHRWTLAGGALAAVAAVLVLAIVGLPRFGPPAPPPKTAGGPAAVATAAAEEAREARAMLEQLRREHRRLEQDLRTLGGFTAGDSGVIYLGGDETLDLVLDLEGTSPWAPAGRQRPDGRRRPSGNAPDYL